jgi:23S rRNA (uridine2552-2'-O)-methyltransferase
VSRRARGPGTGGGKDGLGGYRGRTERVKTAKGRKISSTRWLARQLNDPYVIEARRQGFRSRAAFKLIELDDRFRFLAPGARVVDLGAAPGGWTQVAVKRVGAGASGGGRVIAVDIAEMAPVPGAMVLRGDFYDDATLELLNNALDGPVDVVLSDMAPSATGHAATDHLRIVAMAEAAMAFAVDVLAPGGTFVCKVLQGGTETTMLKEMRRLFAKVRHAKPPASRPESAELYVVAQGFRGALG